MFLRLLSPALLVAALTLPAWAGEQPPVLLPEGGEIHIETHRAGMQPLRIEIPGGHAFTAPATMPKEKAAFLGLTTSPATATLREQLKLQRGIGLTVDFVDEDSPANAAGVKQHDVLTKLDDQWLVNFQQLAVLVRMHKPGDTVKLTYIRQGESKTVDVKLIERELPVMDEHFGPWMMPHEPAGHQFWQRFFEPGGRQGMKGPKDMPGMPKGFGAGAGSVMSMTRADDEHTLSLTVTMDGKHLVARDKTGKVLFDGPVNTPEQRAKVPADVLKKLEALEHKN